MPSKPARRPPCPSPITSRPWLWSKRATARLTRAAPSSFPKSRSTEPARSNPLWEELFIMMQAGIFTGYFPYGLEDTARKIRRLNFNTVQLDLHFRDVDLSAGQITKDKAKKVRDVFRD